MPGSSPFDSYSGRLDEALDAAQKKAEDASQEAEGSGGPFDSFAGRLDQALQASDGEVVDELSAEPPEPVAEPETGQPETPAPTGPLGAGNYVVRRGDCLDSIAFVHGFFWETIWNDPQNSELREARLNPNVLLVNDRVAIPEKKRKDEAGETEQVHRFRRRGAPAHLRMRFCEEDEPRAGESYVLTIDGKEQTGTLDDDGLLDVPIAPNARRASIRIGDDEQELRLMLGSVDPVTEVAGIQGRLNNLGFDAGPVSGEMNPRTQAALKRFQRMHDLPDSGEPDKATRDKLLEVHGT